jgi:hypothetical protein
MLHDQDTTMIIMDPNEKHSLFKMDIERGKIVEEWKVDDNVPVLHMAPESKFAQTQPEKGDLRLFDKIGKNAKTALPAMGDPILGVDVTKDGRWVVATCKTYLLVIDTLIGEGRYSGQLGFDRSFPADAKPIPRRLKLKNPHVQYMGGQVSFSPARCVTAEEADCGNLTCTIDLIWGRIKRRQQLSHPLATMSWLGTSRQ